VKFKEINAIFENISRVDEKYAKAKFNIKFDCNLLSENEINTL
jgi:hypothetical protein